MNKKELLSVVQCTLDGIANPHTYRSYKRAIGDFVEWFGSKEEMTFDRATVLAYTRHMRDVGVPHSSARQRLWAIRRFALEAVEAKLIDEATMQAIHRIEPPQERGDKSGTWLSQDEAQAMLNRPDTSTLKGLRDRAILAIMLGCGLRRTEISSLDVEHIQLHGKRWMIANLWGKHELVRTVPMALWVKQAIDAWLVASGITEGAIFVQLQKGNRIAGERISDQVVWRVVQENNPTNKKIAPHDMRRTFAQLARLGGGGGHNYNLGALINSIP